MLRKIFIITFILVLSSFNCANKNIKLFENEWNKFKKLPELQYADIGLIITDANTDEIIFSENKDRLLLPASLQKIITTAYALENLGDKYKFKTKVFYTGNIDAKTSTLNGDIYIIGGGDPTLDSKYFKNTKLTVIDKIINALKSKNIKNITGDIIVSDAIYGTQKAPSTWSWQDVANYYASGASGFSYADNTYKLHFDTRVNIGAKVKLIRSEPDMQNLTFINEAIAYKGTQDLSYIHGVEYTKLRYIRGEMPQGKSDFVIKGAMTNPPLFFANKLYSKLGENGIKINGNAKHKRVFQPNDAILLTSISSPSLSQIIKSTNHNSNNLYAEHLLRQVLAKNNTNVTIPQALEDMESFWKSKGIFNSAIKYCDGAGLALANRITPRHFAKILFYMKNKSKYSKVFFDSLPLAGKTGTLRRFLNNSNAIGKFKLKSGSFTGIRAYAGYGITKSNREIIMVLMVNNFTGNTYSLKNKMANIFQSAYNEF